MCTCRVYIKYKYTDIFNIALSFVPQFLYMTSFDKFLCLTKYWQSIKNLFITVKFVKLCVIVSHILYRRSP